MHILTRMISSYLVKKIYFLIYKASLYNRKYSTERHSAQQECKINHSLLENIINHNYIG